jgi:hypothetical protein
MTGVDAAATADARTRWAGFYPLRDIKRYILNPGVWPATVKVGCGHYPPNVARQPIGSSAPILAVHATIAQPLEPTQQRSLADPDGFGRACPKAVIARLPRQWVERAHRSSTT